MNEIVVREISAHMLILSKFSIKIKLNQTVATKNALESTNDFYDFVLFYQISKFGKATI